MMDLIARDARRRPSLPPCGGGAGWGVPHEDSSCSAPQPISVIVRPSRTTTVVSRHAVSCKLVARHARAPSRASTSLRAVRTTWMAGTGPGHDGVERAGHKLGTSYAIALPARGRGAQRCSRVRRRSTRCSRRHTPSFRGATKSRTRNLEIVLHRRSSHRDSGFIAARCPGMTERVAP